MVFINSLIPLITRLCNRKPNLANIDVEKGLIYVSQVLTTVVVSNDELTEIIIM